MKPGKRQPTESKGDLGTSDLQGTLTLSAPVSLKVETLEDRVELLVGTIVSPMNALAKGSGEEFGYETSEGLGPNDEDRHWYWKFIRDGQVIGQIDFSIIVERSSRDTFTHPLLSFIYHPNIMGHSFTPPALEEEVPKLAAADKKREVAYIVSTMLGSRMGLLQAAYSPFTPNVSRLIYKAFRNSVTQGYEAHVDEQRRHAVGQVLAAEVMNR